MASEKEKNRVEEKLNEILPDVEKTQVSHIFVLLSLKFTNCVIYRDPIFLYM